MDKLYRESEASLKILSHRVSTHASVADLWMEQALWQLNNLRSLNDYITHSKAEAGKIIQKNQKFETKDMQNEEKEMQEILNSELKKTQEYEIHNNSLRNSLVKVKSEKEKLMSKKKELSKKLLRNRSFVFLKKRKQKLSKTGSMIIGEMS